MKKILVEKFETVQITETFKKREFIIQENKNPEYPEYIKVELIQDKVSLLDSLNIGDEINVLINIKGRKWEDKDGNTRYNTEILANNMTMLGKKDSGTTDAIPNDNPSPEENVLQEEKGDDLPF